MVDQEAAEVLVDHVACRDAAYQEDEADMPSSQRTWSQIPSASIQRSH